MKYIDWSKDKNKKLKKERGIGFEQIVISIYKEKVIDIINNPSSNFPTQKVYVVELNNYVYYVPFVEDEEKIFLKTIIPSRKIRKKYTRK
ncbi:MAG: toxin [bacterium]|nr:toxin [bacterium]